MMRGITPGVMMPISSLMIPTIQQYKGSMQFLRANTCRVVPSVTSLDAHLNGIWNLVIVDNWGGDQGYLEGWTLEFDPTLVPDVTTISPSIGLGIDSSYWDVTLGEDGVQDIDFQADILNLQFDAPGLYDYTFVLTNSFGCVYDTTIVMEVIEGPSSNITAGPDQVFLRSACCFGRRIQHDGTFTLFRISRDRNGVLWQRSQ